MGSELILSPPPTALALCLSPVGWGLCLAVGLVGSWVSFSFCWPSVPVWTLTELIVAVTASLRAHHLREQSMCPLGSFPEVEA